MGVYNSTKDVRVQNQEMTERHKLEDILKKLFGSRAIVGSAKTAQYVSDTYCPNKNMGPKVQ